MNASDAAMIARFVSALPQFGTVPITLPVAGFATLITLPLSAPTQAPLMKLAWHIMDEKSVMFDPY